MQQKIDEITTMQMLMASNGPLSPEQLIVAALHSLNVQHQLECIDKNNEVCQFPADWQSQGDGSYSFRYKSKEKAALLNFRFTIEGKNIVAVFAQDGSSESYRVVVNSHQDTPTIIQNYTFTLKQFLSKESYQPKQSQQQYQTIPPAQGQSYREKGSLITPPIQSSYPPKDLINKGNMQNPFGQEEYVGPNSSIFTNPYVNQPPEYINPLILPPGARYDPVDPFDNPMHDKRLNNPNEDFMGFDEHGMPIKRPFPHPRGSGNYPPNPFQGGFQGGFGRGGFGGGGFGGFGGRMI